MKKLQQLRNQKGFTLIELMIALVVVGFIVTVLVAAFSNPIREASVNQAATKIGDDMRMFDEMAQRFTLNTTTQAGALASLVGAAYFKTLPVAPTQASPNSYALDTATYTNTWGTVAADTVVTLTNVSNLVCQRVNEMYAGDAPAAAIPAAVRANLGLQCFGAGANNNTVLSPIYSN